MLVWTWKFIVGHFILFYIVWSFFYAFYTFVFYIFPNPLFCIYINDFRGIHISGIGMRSITYDYNFI